MKKYNAVIFDLDGVICHTDKYHYEAWKKVADEIGIYFDQEINNRLRGVSRMESFEIILERYNGELNESEKEFWITKKNDIYKELLKNMNTSDLSEEVKATLDGLRAANHKLAIGSSSKNARFILGQLRLGEYLDAISDANNISKSKPDPEVFIKAAEYCKQSDASYAFVSTNSISQGEQVALLWPIIFNNGLEMKFAYTSFKWSNNAKSNAAVTVVIIGVGNKSKNTKKKLVKSEKVFCKAAETLRFTAGCDKIIST